jgi:subtilase family serine protease
MDLDMVSASCPNCHILLVEANKSTIHSLGASVDEAVKLGATIVSNGYGASGTTGSEDYSHAGVIILAASGESGFGVATPAGFPTVVSVGGTSLTQTASGRGWSETAWSGTGSGCTTFAKPVWQTDHGCAQRTMNDVAAVADPNTGVAVYINGWFQFGGTSAATPLLAGVYALAGNASTLDAARSLYQNPSGLFDVTTGSNGTCSKFYLCNAIAGYDGPTGNGTPNGVSAF